MVEYDLIGLLLEKLNATEFRKKFELGLHKSMYRAITVIQDGQNTFSDIMSTRDFIIDFWRYSGKISPLFIYH